MGPFMTKPNRLVELPAALVDVALVDAETSASVGGMSVSWWLERVRDKTAPAPVIRQTRCTRWRLADVRTFWESRGAVGGIDDSRTCRVIEQAQRASKAAKAARASVA